MRLAELQISHTRQVNYGEEECKAAVMYALHLRPKAWGFVALLNAGVDGLTSFNTVGLFTDPQQAWVDSKTIIEGIQKKLASKEEKTQQPNPNAYKDDEGNGGENNKEKDKTEESKQPSKTAMVEE